MDFLLAIPIELRLAVLAVVGAFVGGQLNRAIYRLGWEPRDIGPWSAAPENALPRNWFDCVPIVGWLGLRRESNIHGRGYWLRPLLIELTTAIGFAWLYHWNVQQAGLIAVPPGKHPFDAFLLHTHFLLQVVLISLLITATFIDFDEQTIPDAITLPGTLIALMFAALVPVSRLPVVMAKAPTEGLQLIRLETPQQLTALSPERLPDWPTWYFESQGLACGIACFVGWCLAILPLLWFTRHGFAKSFQYLIAHIIRPRRKTKRPEGAIPRQIHPLIVVIFALMIIGPIGISMCWMRGGIFWASLLSSLLGLAFGGGLIWAVRILGSWALQREAMGFGDVTLMAMIGAFVGWQPSLIIFFLAPLAAVVIAVLQFIFTGRHDIAFGPYLSLGTLILLLGWKDIWNNWAVQIFTLGGTSILSILVVCLCLMGAMLFVWRVLKELIS